MDERPRGIEGLIEKWREQQRQYPDQIDAQAAAAAVRLCADELEAELARLKTPVDDAAMRQRFAAITCRYCAKVYPFIKIRGDAEIYHDYPGAACTVACTSKADELMAEFATMKLDLALGAEAEREACITAIQAVQLNRQGWAPMERYIAAIRARATSDGRHVHTDACFADVPETEGVGEYLRCQKVAGDGREEKNDVRK